MRSLLQRPVRGDDAMGIPVEQGAWGPKIDEWSSFQRAVVVDLSPGKGASLRDKTPDKGMRTMHDLDLTTIGPASLAGHLRPGLCLVIFEETTHLRKSKPVLLAAGLIWVLIGMAYARPGNPRRRMSMPSQIIEEYGELFLFLLVAITYVNTLEERRVFDVLRARLIGMGFSYRQLFWITGICRSSCPRCSTT